MKKITSILLAMLLIVSCAFMGCKSGSSGEEGKDTETKSEYPKKDIQIVCHTDPGDGADLYVRAIADAINTDKLMPVTVTVENKSGGSGANMYNYMMTKKGDPYYIMTCQPNILTSPIKNNLDIRYTDFTAVARLAEEPLVVSVNAESDFKTMEDLINAAKKEERAITQAGGLAGATEYFLSYKIEQETGVVFNLLPHAGGGSEALVTVLAGDADFMISNPSEVLSQVEAGKMRILATGSEERLSILPDVPTLKEAGIDATFGMFRGVAMPSGIDEETVDYLAEVLEKVTQTQKWKDYCDENGLVTAYMNADDFKAYLDEQAPVFEEVLSSYGDRLN